MKKIAATVFTITAVMSAQERLGFIHGTVVDPSDAVIVGARVEVSSGEQKCETTSNAEGKFNCQLPPGRYRIIATDPRFFPYRRATVNLEVLAHASLKLRTVPGPTRGISVPHSGDDILGDATSPVSYQEQAIQGNADVVVRYHGSEEKEGKIIFRGPYLMLTVDTLAVYADEMTCSNPIRSCTARGSVIAEVGAERLEGTVLDLDLSTRKFVLTRDANVVRAF